MEKKKEVNVVCLKQVTTKKRVRCILIATFVVFVICGVCAVIATMLHPVQSDGETCSPPNISPNRFTKLPQSTYTSSMYRIYVPAFNSLDDSPTAIGNIAGVTEKLHYFAKMNISTLWISSVQKVNEDNDEVTSFSEVDLTLAYEDEESNSFNHFIQTAQSLGIKVIMDIIINHSSSVHNWFLNSKKNDSRHRDYYIWHPGRMMGGQRQPPNNWISVNGKSAWTWNDERQAYYFHRFDDRRPDLNWENERVQQEMKGVLRKWLGRGLFGFYIRDFAYLSEGNSSRWGTEAQPTTPYDLPENMDLLNMFQQEIQHWKKENNISDERILLFSSKSTIQQADSIPGVLLGLVDEDLPKMENLTAKQLRGIVETNLNRPKENGFPVWLLGNEMTSRIATKFGPRAASGLQLVQMLLPGSSAIYYGEEIGMTDLPSSSTMNLGYECNLKKEDHYRSPMQWNGNEFGAGFSNKKNIFPPVHTNYREINVELQMKSNSSLWKTMKTLVHLRRSQFLRDNQIDFPPSMNDDDLLTFIRFNHNTMTRYLIALNMGNSNRMLNVQCALNSTDIQIIFPTQLRDAQFNLTDFLLQPSNTVVFSNQ